MGPDASNALFVLFGYATGGSKFGWKISSNDVPSISWVGGIVNAIQESVELALGVSREYLLHHRVCPKHRQDDGTLVIAVAPQALREAVAELAVTYRCRAITEEISDDELDRLIERLTTHADRSLELARIDLESDDLATDVRDLANQPPVVRYVNLLVRDAYDAGASDIHLEATRTGLSARFRLDGVLAPAPEPPPQLHHAVISRIKLLAELDIAERRKPQDGRVRVRLEQRELDLRVSTVPTMFGESVVLRLLDRGGRPVQLDGLGMPSDVLSIMTSLATRPHGMVLVTGPTGSGKTTTLYAALQRRETSREKIITVEDPVEYQLDGVTQVPVHRQAGVTFGSALRSILRQDPDVVMIGEMRDPETAEIGVQAAMTGHLVFSTLHTNDALGAIPRLFDLGVAPYLVAGTLDGVLAQRLVRVICEHCRTMEAPSPEQIQMTRRWSAELPDRLARGVGCSRCRGTGFQGRLGVFELLFVDESVREQIVNYHSRGVVAEAAREAGMRSMLDDGWSKVREGLTTIDEVLRVVQPQ